MANSVTITFEKGIPIPPQIGRWSGVRLSDKERRAKNVEYQRTIFNKRKALGICTWSNCPESSADGHVMCRPHLDRMLQQHKQRCRERKARGACRQCEQPVFADSVFCLIHRQGDGMPHVVTRGLKEYRAREKAAQREAERDALRPKLHLLNERQRQIITLRNGLDGNGDCTLEQVGQIFGVTRERIRQIEEKAMFLIEHDIPMSPLAQSKFNKTFEAMKVGDSFLCSENQRVSASNAARRLKLTIAARKQPDGQVRIWLLENNNSAA